MWDFILFQRPRLNRARCPRTIFLGTRVQRRRVQRPSLPLDEVEYACRTTRIGPGGPGAAGSGKMGMQFTYSIPRSAARSHHRQAHGEI